MIRRQKPHLRDGELKIAIGAILERPTKSVGTYVLLAAVGSNPVVQTNAADPKELTAFLAAAQLNLMRDHFYREGLDAPVRWAGLEDAELQVRLAGLLQCRPPEVGGYAILALCPGDDGDRLVTQTSAEDLDTLLVFTSGALYRLLMEMAPGGRHA